MSDAAYWKQRCESAESALRRARSRIWISDSRRAVLAMLAEMKAGETITTSQVAQRLGVTPSGALASLRKLEGAGLVDRNVARGCHYRPFGWSLGHLVVVDELEGLDA